MQRRKTKSVPLPATRETQTTRRTIRDLTEPQRWLIQIMSENQFGRIENLRVEGGQPVPGRCLKIVRVKRLGANSGGPPNPADAGDFELKQANKDLLDELSRIGNGGVCRIEFRHGLAFQVETTARADDDSVAQSGVV